MEHGHLGLLLSISCCQLLSKQILFDSLLLAPPIILSGLPASSCNLASPCNIASMQHCIDLPCNIALIFHVTPCSIALIFHVTDPLDCCLLLQSSFLDSLHMHHHAVFASMQHCNNLACNIALIFHAIPCSLALIHHVTDLLHCCSLIDTLSEFFWTVVICLPMLSCQCDYRI